MTRELLAGRRGPEMVAVMEVAVLPLMLLVGLLERGRRRLGSRRREGVLRGVGKKHAGGDVGCSGWAARKETTVMAGRRRQVQEISLLESSLLLAAALDGGRDWAERGHWAVEKATVVFCRRWQVRVRESLQWPTDFLVVCWAALRWWCCSELLWAPGWLLWTPRLSLLSMADGCSEDEEGEQEVSSGLGAKAAILDSGLATGVNGAFSAAVSVCCWWEFAQPEEEGEKEQMVLQWLLRRRRRDAVLLRRRRELRCSHREEGCSV